jgi:orotate phosphoribosyltransferase
MTRTIILAVVALLVVETYKCAAWLANRILGFAVRQLPLASRDDVLGMLQGELDTRPDLLKVPFALEVLLRSRALARAAAEALALPAIARVDAVLADVVLRREHGFQVSPRYWSRNFVDIERVLAGKMRVLAEAICDKVRANLDVSSLDCIVGAKQGNTGIPMLVAELLGLPCVLVRDSPLAGSWIEGAVRSGQALFCDDVAYDAEVLIPRIERARESGFVIEDCAVVVDRNEGDAAERLTQIGVRLWAVKRYSDDDLDDM